FQPFASNFALPVAGGTTYGGLLDPATSALPAWAGRTIGVFDITDAQEGETLEDWPLVGSATLPGRFVPISLDGSGQFYGVSIGSPTSVTAPDGDLFPGVRATVTADDLTPGDDLEMWLVDRADYFWFFLTMAALPADAVSVGHGTVDEDGTFTGEFDVPANTPLSDEYQLLLGVPGENYWPAGGYEYFDISEPDASASALTSDGASTTTLGFEVTQVSMTFPAGTTGGTTTAAVSSTGPAAGEFTFGSDPPLYYHLNTTAVPGGPVTVCITYDTANIPGDPPWLYHHEQVAAGYRWTNITTSRTAGLVCGSATSFSPFTLGYPIEPDDGSVAPPAKGTLASDNGWDNGLRDSAYNVIWNLRSGENASYVRLFENGTLVGEQSLTYGGQHPQRATFPLSGKANGTYVYTAELENSRGTTMTAPLTVKVTHALPAKPVLLHDNLDRDGRFTLSAVLLLGTNATSYRFYEGSTIVGQGTLTARSPLPQLATLKLSGVSKGTHTYRVEFGNAMGTTTSNSVSVSVTKK
ncbi:MAG TPA: hypothetical protein VI121_07445, partial [Agromyces sp.]